MDLFSQIGTWLTNGQALQFIISLVFAFGFVLLTTMINVFLERKILAFMQDRWGPLHYGPGGILQMIIDPVKLLFKEDIKTTVNDKAMFNLAPMVFFAPAIASFVVIPFSPYVTASALNTGIILLIALSSLDVIGVIMAGWGSNNKYSLIGGLRSAAQMISYELPLVLSLVGVVMLSSTLVPGCAGTHPDLTKCGIGSISLTDLVHFQMNPWWLWFVVLQPLGLIIYYTCGLAETNRTPFDLPEAESELVAGFMTEYSGMRWALFFLGEYSNMMVVSCIATALFLGGWSGPGADLAFWTAHAGGFWGPVIFNCIAIAWFIVKAYSIIIVYMWIRTTLPRLRADQLMRFAWLVLIPITLFNIIISGVILLAINDLTTKLIVLGVVNWLMVIFYIFFLGRLTGVSRKGRLTSQVKARLSSVLTSQQKQQALTPTH